MLLISEWSASNQIEFSQSLVIIKLFNWGINLMQIFFVWNDVINEEFGPLTVHNFIANMSKDESHSHKSKCSPLITQDDS